jgi:alkylation response protein AidB-like acyl-CoA dehydrogenase
MHHNVHVSMLLDRIKAMAPLIRLEAESSNDQRQLSEPLVEALHDIGIFRMYVPQRYGGLGLTPIEIMPVAEALAHIDASTAWAAVVGAGSLAFATLMHDDAARTEILSAPRASGAGSGGPAAFRLGVWMAATASAGEPLSAHPARLRRGTPSVAPCSTAMRR